MAFNKNIQMNDKKNQAQPNKYKNPDIGDKN